MKNASHGGDIGKYKILLDEVSSTQTYALDLVRTGKINHGTMVSCRHQTQGKGRMDKSWTSSKNQNFTASFILNELNKAHGCLPGHISMLAALSVTHAIRSFIPDGVMIKWPNDVICDSKKLAGILITNQWRGSQLESSVIGIGINVNQTFFGDAPRAGSIKMITSKDLNTNDVALSLITQLNYWYEFLLEADKDLIRQEYHQALYGFGQAVDILMTKANNLKKGKMIEVMEDGKVKVEFNDFQQGMYDIDEIKIMF